jgi:hypothetical protein
MSILKHFQRQSPLPTPEQTGIGEQATKKLMLPLENN